MCARSLRKEGFSRTSRLSDVHAPPERHIIANGFRFRLRIGIGPRRVRVEGAIDADGEVMRGPLPRADGSLPRRFKKIAVDRVRRKIVVALDFDCRVTVGDYRPVPPCL